MRLGSRGNDRETPDPLRLGYGERQTDHAAIGRADNADGPIDPDGVEGSRENPRLVDRGWRAVSGIVGGKIDADHIILATIERSALADKLGPPAWISIRPE